MAVIVGLEPARRIQLWMTQQTGTVEALEESGVLEDLVRWAGHNRGKAQEDDLTVTPMDGSTGK